MTPGQNFSCRKIFEILVVSNNINGKSRTFKIMPPYFKNIKNSQQFLVMNIIVDVRATARMDLTKSSRRS